MTAIAAPRLGTTTMAAKALRGSAVLWFVTAVIGQTIFAAYIVAFYGRTAAAGNYEAWNKVLRHGFIAGDTKGNLFLAAHLLLAFIITVGGPLQLVPKLRNRFRALHRWVGRIYMITAFILSFGGLYLIWSRMGIPGTSIVNGVAISINALLIVACGVMAWRYGLARKINLHRRWALRLFVVVSGVWFLRVGVMLWILLVGPVGLGDNLTGPAGHALNFAQYIVPLAILELYLRAQTSPSVGRRYATAGLLSLLTIGMAGGITMATLFMWMPHI